MYCSKCGVQNSDGATHCANCGSVLMDVSQSPLTGGQPQTQAAPVAPQTCGMAVASMIFGILSMLCITWPICGPLAIIFGVIALIKIGDSKGRLKGTGMAVTGLIIPAVFIVVGPILMAILMPALSQTKRIAQRVVCGTNLKGLSTAMIVYINDYEDQLPTEHWCDLLIEEADVSPQSFLCPDSDVIEGESAYAMNENIAGMNSRQMSANVVLIFETDKGKEPGPRDTPLSSRRCFEYLDEHGMYYDPGTLVYKDRFNQLGGPDDLVLRHDSNGRSGCNITFVDGHTEFVTEDRITDLKWMAE